MWIRLCGPHPVYCSVITLMSWHYKSPTTQRFLYWLKTKKIVTFRVTGVVRKFFDRVVPWWRHQMETFSALLAICAGNSPAPGEFPTAQRSVTRSFDVFFDPRLNKQLTKQSWGWWFETLSSSLWRHCNAAPVFDRIPLKKFWNHTLGSRPFSWSWAHSYVILGNFIPKFHW